MTRGLDGCLWLLTVERWERLEGKLDVLRKDSYGFGSEDARGFVRDFYRAMTSLKLDGHGRIALNERQKTLSGIEREVEFIGMPDWVEVWDPRRLESYDDEVFNRRARMLLG